MRVHNYYSDILSRLYMFLNTDVLSGANRIRNVQYNLGSATTVLEYRDSYDLPNAVIKYESADPWQSMPLSPRTFQNVGGMMTNPSDRFIAIYNETKGIELSLQMQYFTVTVSAAINCGSQMQALNMQHEIMQRMPVDRLLNQFSFISFFELDEKYLNPMVFDTQNDFITNLFVNVDQTTNRSNYSFSFPFEPLVKLSSTPQIQLDDITKAAYQILANFEINLQIPQFLISESLPGSSRSVDRNKLIKSEKVGQLINPQTTIPVYHNYLYFDIDNGSVRDMVALNPSLIDSNNKLLYNGVLSDGKSYSLESDFIGVNTYFNYSVQYKGEILSGRGVLFIYSSGVSVCKLTDDLFGNILNPQQSKNPSTLSGIFLGSYKEEFVDNAPMVLDLSWERTRPVMSASKVTPSNWTLRNPAVRDVYSVAKNVNAYRSTLNFAQSGVSDVTVLDIPNNVITKNTLASEYLLMPDGSFSISLTSPHAMTVSGKFNKTTSFLDNVAISDPNFEVVTLGLIPVWDYLPYGSSQFDSINLDIGGVSNSAIPSIYEHDAFIDRISTLDTSYVSLYSTLPYTTYNNMYTFSIAISSELRAIDPTTINKKFEIYFIHNGQFLSSTNTTTFTLDLMSSIPTDFVFRATEDFRLRVLDNITSYSPLYFGIVILP